MDLSYACHCYGLTNEQIEELKLAIEEAERASCDGEMIETWKKFGL